MLPLAGSALPDSLETLVAALRGGLAAHGVVESEVNAFGTWPQLEALRLDLTGAAVEAMQSFPPPGGERSGVFFAREFSLQAVPARLRSEAIDLQISGRDATFAFAPAASGAVLLLADAADGDVALQLQRVALERLVHQLASAAAGEHGVEIKSVRFDLTSRGPRAVSLVAEVTAKAFIASATVKITGDADLDEQLVARLSHLRFHGEGMIANLAGGVIRPQLARLEGKTLSLTSFMLGALSLRDVALETGEAIRLTARFGRNAPQREIV